MAASISCGILQSHNTGGDPESLKIKTGEEKDIIRAGCLINFNKGRKG